MIEGVRILIDRMETHPEEFVGELSYRWAHIMNDIAKHGPEFLDEEDLLAIGRKIQEVRRKDLTAKVVEEIHTARRLKKAQEEFEMKENMAKTAVTSSFGHAPVKKQGASISYFTWSDYDAFDRPGL